MTIENPARALALMRWAAHPPVEREYVCERCNKPFTARAVAKFCSASCRQMAYFARKREKAEVA